MGLGCGGVGTGSLVPFNPERAPFFLPFPKFFFPFEGLEIFPFPFGTFFKKEKVGLELKGFSKGRVC